MVRNVLFNLAHFQETSEYENETAADLMNMNFENSPPRMKDDTLHICNLLRLREQFSCVFANRLLV